jgi:membrane glycosyltransferase
MPKLLVGFDAVATGRAHSFGGASKSLRAVLAELALSSLIAPVLLAFQSRSVVQVFLGRDGGWPTNNRGDGGLSLSDGWAAGRWISACGLIGIVITQTVAPILTLWLLPVALPMILAPVLIWWTSRPSTGGVFPSPTDHALPPIVVRHQAIFAAWSAPIAERQVA